MDDWMTRLKAACDAGYYRTEGDPEEQSSFPWQNTVCGDCPFWMNERCQIDLRPCVASDIPCEYFDPPDFPAARWAIEQRLRVGWKKIWRWEE